MPELYVQRNSTLTLQAFWQDLESSYMAKHCMFKFLTQETVY